MKQSEELVRMARQIERQVSGHDGGDGLRYGMIDFSQSPETVRSLLRHYEILYDFVRECQSVRKAFLEALRKDDQYIWLCYDILTKLVTFHYDIFNTVLDEAGAARIIEDIVRLGPNSKLKEPMAEYDRVMTDSPRLWKKGELRQRDKIVRSYRDKYLNILRSIPCIIGFGAWTIERTRTEILARIAKIVVTRSERRILSYLFSGTLWMHSHYLDHLQNIYWFLKSQTLFVQPPNTSKHFAWVQDNSSGQILNGMLVTRNEHFPEYQEHVFIHHNLYARIYGREHLPDHLSMRLHSYAMKAKSMIAFPLAVMFDIMHRYCEQSNGQVTMTLFERPIFPHGVIPPGFIYQPRLAIPLTPSFRDHWHSSKSIIVEEKKEGTRR